ncbi:MAG: T9SS type A sorting domain-containing protein [Paraprevotella sp.]|nr:T9SS type A sorting domain-containing protein [Paraprevotella sp.]
MKKTISTLFLGLACALGAQAQEYNLFADVDADGWLWFDSQEKIDKYVGICDEENYKVDPNGKPIQLVYADIMPDYPETTADPFWEGAGADGEIGGEGYRTGALITAPASASMSPNGGGFVVLMPSCTSYSICLSREGSTEVRMMASKDVNTPFTNYDVITAAYALVLKPLFRGGIYTWSGIETLTNGNDGAYALKSDQPIYAYFQSLTADPIYIHGIRVTTPTNSTMAIKETQAKTSHIFFEGNRVVLNEAARIQVYGTDGMKMADSYTDQMDLSNLPNGIYIVKAGDSTRKIAIQ